MTRDQLLALQPGDVIRRLGARRTLRVVLAGPGRTRGGAMGPVGLVKVGYSWTNPNPSAWYDAHVVLHGYAVTGARGMSREYATRMRHDWREMLGEVPSRFRKRRRCV
jgi:hypothetical protein